MGEVRAQELAQTSQVSGIGWIIAGVPQSCDWEFGVAGGCRGEVRPGEDEFARDVIDLEQKCVMARRCERSRVGTNNEGWW